MANVGNLVSGIAVTLIQQIQSVFGIILNCQLFDENIEHPHMHRYTTTGLHAFHYIANPIKSRLVM